MLNSRNAKQKVLIINTIPVSNRFTPLETMEVIEIPESQSPVKLPTRPPVFLDNVLDI